jgi:DNA-binding CsgD family transcriptional regulator
VGAGDATSRPEITDVLALNGTVLGVGRWRPLGVRLRHVVRNEGGRSGGEDPPLRGRSERGTGRVARLGLVSLRRDGASGDGDEPAAVPGSDVRRMSGGVVASAAATGGDTAVLPGEAASDRGAPVAGVLLQRDVELGLVGDLVGAVGAGRGRVLLFEAAAGLGKSALLEHGVSAGREAGLGVWRARGHELERGFAWGVARSLFEASLLGYPRSERERLLDGPAAAARAVFGDGDGGAAPLSQDVGFAITHALYWLALRLAEREPLLVVVDDAHWVDDPSLRWLIYLSGRVSAAPIGVLVAARSGEPGSGDLVDVLATDPAARVHVMRPLGAAAVGELVRRRLPGAGEGFRRRCFELTAGNPLHLRALFAALEPSGPDPDEADLAAGATTAARALERSVLRRLAAMAPPARALAEAVAVFEDDVPLDLAAALAGLEPVVARKAADELVRADVLRPGDPLGFIHPLLRVAVYGGLPERVRGDTHRRAAQLLATAGAADEQVCAHLLEASPADDEDVVERLRANARRALAHGAPASAVEYLRRALCEPPPDRTRPAVLAELGHAEATAGGADAIAHLEAAIALVDDPRERARLLLEFGRALHHSGRLTDACAAFRRGLDELGMIGGEDTDLRVELEGGYLNAALFVPDRSPDTRQRAREIMAGADKLTSAAEFALLSKAIMLELWAGGSRDELISAAHRLLSDGRLTEEDAADTQAPWHLIATLGWCDDYPGADEALRMAFADAGRRGSVLAYVLACVFRSRHALWTGPLGDAVHDARAALELSPPRSVYLCSAAYCLVSALLEQEEEDEAEAVLRHVDRQLPAPPPFFAAWRQMAGGRLAACRGDHASAIDAYLAAGRHHTALGIVNPAVLPWRSEAALAARRLGRLERAQALVDEELALAERFGGPRPIGVAWRAAGLLARGEAAVELLRSAGETLAGCGARVEQARVLTDLGAATRRAGRPSEARKLLRDAARLAEDTGALRVAAQARGELRAAGGRAPARATGPGERLTAGERRVVELAAAGQTNRQIANALFITVKAVEWHLSNAYRRLGISGRAELSQALAARAEAPD